MELSSKMGRLLDRVMEGLAWFAGLLMLFALITVCVDVVMRYFFNNPTGWVLQFSEYILLYIPFLAAAYVLKEESHIKIDIVLNRLSEKAQALMNMVTSILGFFVLVVLTYYGALITFDYYQRKVPTIEYLKIPECLVIIVIPIGCFLFSIQFIRRVHKYYRILRAQNREGGIDL
ncbi:MAG: TRAP transporter small permease [Pseudomonadota bacterium]